MVELDGVYTVNGFTMATANDNADYNGRNPNDWTISVSADGENWTELAKGDDTFFEETNFTYYNGDASAEGVSFVKFEAASSAAGRGSSDLRLRRHCRCRCRPVSRRLRGCQEEALSHRFR